MRAVALTYLRRAPTAALVVAGLLAICGAYLGGASVAISPQRSPAVAPKPAVKPSPTLAGVVQPQLFRQLTPQDAAMLNAAMPISRLPNPAAAPFVLRAATSADGARAETCLAMAVYYEAANQGPDGEAAVAQVVLNRLRNPMFPKTVCGVVFQGSTLPTGCQFTFTCDGSMARPPSVAGWRDALYVARRALSGYVMRDVGEATHYHTIWVVPYWQSTVMKVAQLGAHVFYRWNGALGQPAAFNGTYGGAEFVPPLPRALDKAVQLQSGAAQATIAQSVASAAASAEEPRPAVVMTAPALASRGDLPGSVSLPAGQISQTYFDGQHVAVQHLPM